MHFPFLLPSRERKTILTINVHWTLDNCFNQDKIQAKNENYLAARVTLNKIAFNLLTKKKEELIKSGMHRLSMDSLKQLCQSPADALETVYNVLGTSWS